MATINSINSNIPIPVAFGGTGAVTETANSLLLGNGTSPISALGAATDGQIPIGRSGNSPLLASITAGSGISVTPGAGSITIAATGGSGVASVAGNSGGALTGALSLVTANTNIKVAGSGSTLTMDFSPASPSQSIYIGSFSAGSTGLQNTSLGQLALGTASATGGGNTAVGFEALHLNDTCTSNVAVGVQALNVLAGGGSTVDTAVGWTAGASLQTGVGNCLFGAGAGDQITTGSRNVCLGLSAGHTWTTSESNNIAIGTGGGGSNDVIGSNNKLIIGQSTGTGTNQLNSAFICGIQGITVTGTPVLVSSSDQLGIAVSSRKFKLDIKDADNASDVIYKLRPVTFVWDRSSNPGLKDAPTDRQVGLIAEEVAQVSSDLVGFDKQGQPLNVNYDRLIPMLLNEIHRLEKRISALESK